MSEEKNKPSYEDLEKEVVRLKAELKKMHYMLNYELCNPGSAIVLTVFLIAIGFLLALYPDISNLK